MHVCAMALLVDALPAHLDAGWLPAAVALHLLSQVVRSRGRFNLSRPQHEAMLARTFGNADDGLHHRLLAFSGGAET
jgi:hypothetical protein